MTPIEESEKLLGRKLKGVEKFLIENMYDENVYIIAIDEK